MRPKAFVVLSVLLGLANGNWAWASGSSLRSAEKLPVKLGPKSSPEACDLSQWSLDDKIGQLLWIGIKRPEDLPHYRPSGVILFKWNFKSLPQLRNLNRQLQSLARDKLRAPLFIGIDHEGGKIDRLGYSLTPFPDAASMGAVRDEQLIYRAGEIMGQELSALGINTNLAPVLDLGDARTFLENRIWGQRPEVVAEKTEKFIQGLSAAGVFPVAKHFPGHGGSRTDAHFKMPVVRKSFERLWEEDLKPFQRAIQENLPALMTAHVEVPAVDRGPASLSPKFLRDVLREKLGFRGLVVTDDLEMGGVFSQAGGLVEEAALKAFRSGTDQLLVVWSDQSKSKIIERLKRAAREEPGFGAEIDAKVCRVLASKKNWLREVSFEDKDWQKNIRKETSMRLARQMTKQALLWVAGPKEKILGKMSEDWGKRWRVAVTFPSEAQFWKKNRPQDEVFVLGRRPDEKQKQRLTDFLDAGANNHVTVILTGPRHSLGDEAYESFLNWAVGKSTAQYGLQIPRILWIHKGMSPVLLRTEGRSAMPIGILSLNGGMSLHLEAFFEWVEEFRNSAKKDLALIR